MFDTLPGNPPSLVKRRVTVRQIAEKARLSVATVHRLINGLTTVPPSTALRVQSAAQALGYQCTVPMRVRQDETIEPTKCTVLLQRKASFFYQHLAEELEQAVHHDPTLGIELNIEHMDDYLDPAKIADRLRAIDSEVDAVAVVATETMYVSDAITFLGEQEPPVVALLSDLSSPSLGGYVGINNRMAGRTAAWGIARCADRSGTVAVLIGSHGYIGQEEREIGFRSYFPQKDLNFKLLEPVLCFSQRATTSKPHV